MEVTSINTATLKCGKCNGTGNIPGFIHVSEGRCFVCNGTGEIPESKKHTVLYSRTYINQFLQKGFFPEDQSNLKKIVCYGNQEHATAQSWLMTDNEYYYLGQPVCRSSTWYKVPIETAVDFFKHFKKATKVNIQL